MSKLPFYNARPLQEDKTRPWHPLGFFEKPEDAAIFFASHPKCAHLFRDGKLTVEVTNKTPNPKDPASPSIPSVAVVVRRKYEYVVEGCIEA